MSLNTLSQEQASSFKKDGYIIIKDFCNRNEVKKLYQSAVNDTAGNDIGAFNRQPVVKHKSAYWHYQDNDVFGYLSSSEKIIRPVAQLLDGDSPVCHIKSNLVEKKPNIGGVWQWHQDYCYWYENNFMFPDQIVSVMVAITDINKKNGCSQIIKGSHKLGRINHSFERYRLGADPEVVHDSLQNMELVHAELDAGDAIFFHSNLLHRSDANTSDDSIWSVISCYSSKSNVPYNENFKSWHVPVDMVPDAAIMQCSGQHRFYNEEQLLTN